MKKVVLAFLSFLFFLVSKAQVAELLSLGTATIKKDSMGNFTGVREWIVQKTYINFDLNDRKIQFFSKAILGGRPVLTKEVVIINKSTTSDGLTTEFNGVDKHGRKCKIRLTSNNGAYDTKPQELRIEYAEYAEIYTITTKRYDPTYL